MYKLAQSDFAQPPLHLVHVYPRRQLHVSDECLSQEEFARHQRRTSERDLASLVWQCGDRYLFAQSLLHPGAGLGEFDRQSTASDLTRLYGPWDKVCVAYRRHVFDPQIDLFEAQQDRELTRWNEFQRRFCFGPILHDPAYTRCILETVGLLQAPSDTPMTSLETMFECLITNILQRYNAHERIEN